MNRTAERGQQGRPSTEEVNRAALANTSPLEALDLAMGKAIPRLIEIVPKGVDPLRVIQLAMSCARRDEKLQRCTTASMLIATAQIAALGLEPGTALQQAYLVPRKNRKKRGAEWIEVHEATAIIGYRGLVLLAHDSEGIGCQAEVVHMGDTFRERAGLVPVLDHEQSEDTDPGKLRGAYAVWELSNGKRRHLWWPIARLIEHRDRFAPRGFADVPGDEKPITGPWSDHLASMCMKTVVRAAAKLWPLSSDRMRHALTVDDAGEQGRSALAFVPGAKPEMVRAMAIEAGEPPETFDAQPEDSGGRESEEHAREMGDDS